MKLYRRETQLLRYLRVFDFLCILEGEAFDPLGHVRAAGNGAPTAKCLELDV